MLRSVRPKAARRQGGKRQGGKSAGQVRSVRNSARSDAALWRLSAGYLIRAQPFAALRLSFTAPARSPYPHPLCQLDPPERSSGRVIISGETVSARRAWQAFLERSNVARTIRPLNRRTKESSGQLFGCKILLEAGQAVQKICVLLTEAWDRRARARGARRKQHLHWHGTSAGSRSWNMLAISSHPRAAISGEHGTT